MHCIRQATVADVELIRQLAHDTWWPAYSPILATEQIAYMLAEIYSAANITAQIQHNTQTYLLLFEGEAAAGFAAYSPRENQPLVYKLHKLYCLPAMQGKGYGRALIEAVEQHAVAAGATALNLNVNRQNKAKTVYERLGFTVLYTEDIPIGPYFMNDFVMRKGL